VNFFGAALLEPRWRSTPSLHYNDITLKASFTIRRPRAEKPCDLLLSGDSRCSEYITGRHSCRISRPCYAGEGSVHRH